MSFSQNAAWAIWCASQPFECLRFENEANIAIAAANAGNLRPAEKFLEEWQEIADRNETAGVAIQNTLDEIRSALSAAAKAAVSPLVAGLKPLLFPASVATALILAWKK